MATKMTKRGQLDNVITYEHVCDTKADMANIPSAQATLGSIAMVLKDESENGAFEVYMVNTAGEWIPLLGGAGGASDTTLETLNITENGTYIVTGNKAWNKVIVNVPNQGA